MKNSYILLIFIFSVSAKAQIINFPDPYFKAGLINSGIDTNNDAEIDLEEALATLAINLDDSRITSLSGIENFTNLINFGCTNLSITELNLSSTAVNFLYCINNPNLISINIKNNVESQYIFGEPPVPPFFLDELPALQSVCCDAVELQTVQDYFTFPNITISTDCGTLGVAKPNATTKFSVFPNPAQSILNFKTNQVVKILNISIYNLQGRLVKSVSKNQNFISVDDLMAGIYLIEIASDKEKTVQKFIKN